MRTLSAVLALAVLSATAAAQTPADTPLRTAGDRPIDIKHLRLDLKVDLPKKTVDAVATLTFRTTREQASFALDAVGFEVLSVGLTPDGDREADARFRHDGQHLRVELPESMRAEGKAGSLRVTYRVREPRDGLYFFGPTAAEPDVPLTVWSQGEAITNRFWFPCLDHPDQKQTTELVATVAEGFEVLSNGKLLDRKVNADKTVTFHWKQDQPHVAYLVTLVVGQFDIVAEDWKGLPVSYYVPKGRKDDVARTFGRTRAMLDFFSRRFGVQYPWEKYAQVVVEQFSAGGMENTSATTLTDRSLHDQRAFLDSNADALIAHELAHQWWGDLVTCRDWSHIWLNEGFASFSEVIWLEHDRGDDEGAYELIRKGRAAIAGGRDKPIVDRRYVAARLVFDARAYPKGAWVLHMLRRKLGDDAFWKGVRAYAEEHKFKSVETGDFRRAMEKSSGKNLERFFYDWTERPAHPLVEVSTDYLADTHQLRLRVKQTQTGEAFHFPLEVDVPLMPRMPMGSPAGTFRKSYDITEKEQVLFVNLPENQSPAAVILDPRQTLLAEFVENKGRDWWAGQLALGGVAAKARAAEWFGKSRAPADRELLAKALRDEKFWGVRAEIAAALAETGGDVARTALAEGLKSPDPKVRRACADNLGKFFRDPKAAEVVKAALDKGDESYFVEAALVGAYGKLGQPDAVAVLLPWAGRPSHNEVIRSAALTGLGETGDLSALDGLISWTKRGKHRQARAAALTGLAKLATRANPSPEQRTKLAEAAAACLEGEHPIVRRAAVDALREMGSSASPAAAALEAMARHDPDPRIGELAKKAAEQARGNAPPVLELARLREELEKLRKANQLLAERLDRSERPERK